MNGKRNSKRGESPQFTHLDKVKTFRTELFDRFVCPDEDRRDLIIASLLVENSRVLISGNPEAGKTTLVRLIAKGFSKHATEQPSASNPVYAKITGAPEQTLQKVLATTNITKLITEGKEEIVVRPVVKARIKFLNEINRFSKAIQDAFLSLLEEGEVEYGGEIYATPDFLCFADMNPHRGDIDIALKTRFMVSIFLPFVGMGGDMEILDEMFFSGKETRDLAEKMPAILSIKELQEIWEDVTTVTVPDHAKAFLSALISAFKVCKHKKSEIMPGYLRTICQKCEFNNEICSHVKKIPGERASIAGILYTRARAWLHHRKQVTLEDVKWVIPWVLAHRIQLTAAVKSEVPNPWKWCKDAVENLMKAKWYYDEKGERNYGIWVKGFALASFALDWELLPLFKETLNKVYPTLRGAPSEDAKFKAVRKLRELAYGTGEGGRGDLVLREIYQMAREAFKQASRKAANDIRPAVEAIVNDEDATLDDVLEAFNKLNKTLPEESEDLRRKLRRKLEKLTVRVSLKFPGRAAKVEELLHDLKFSEEKITNLLDEKTLKIQNENVRVQRSGETMIFRVRDPETATVIRQNFWTDVRGKEDVSEKA